MSNQKLSFTEQFHNSYLTRVSTQILRFDHNYGYPKPEVAVDNPKEYECKRKKYIEIIMEYRQHKRETKIRLPIYNRDSTISRPDRLQIK